ncbi:uncharacterized protein NP_7074A (plasmid) [Natronomonas pharaonis DSM 2160]|uniref:Small CPxCG-related zinc finger protein n=1 Tax=Natronomonas pharaonis (strain ATCC 35678 / DSM 2160 / CIP 103997 / JCM 8858 / NBRC 14720 / NCIMB 2260 / Gabara) TaxID=348780 RepID=Q3ILR8_NATPD|nr:hypothetical protein [Natronomonas pharaonis]CAI49716.1 uncharacterized protein NP_3250A [Natronomonas pharaonis DSM 2160]CAI50953.1 uncharacterized protein NP_7074A [Natronomonas pharaonis DSM 2160]
MSTTAEPVTVTCGLYDAEFEVIVDDKSDIQHCPRCGRSVDR